MISMANDWQRLLPPAVEFVRLEGHRLTVRMRWRMATAERGAMLLALERFLRQRLRQPIEVFLEPQVDANKLRVKLRGVKV